MKILHTADWHIGKLVNGIHLTNDQEYMLGQLKKYINDEKPDVLIIAGDLYDRSIPPIEAVELLDGVLSDILKDNDISIMAIAGNHDSPDRVSFASEILKKQGLYIEGILRREIKPVKIKDQFGEVNFYLIPYAEPALVRELYENPEIKTPDQAMKAIISNLNIDKNERNVFIGHAFVSYFNDDQSIKEMQSESERPLSIGGSEIISVDCLEDFDYVALGHLHRPQKVKNDNIRYSGSLLKYSFNEYRQKKSVTLINLGEKGDFKYKLKEFKPLRDMRIIRGPIEELLSQEVVSQANEEDYIKAEILDDGALIDPIGKLRAVYPNVLSVERIYGERDLKNIKTSAGQGFEKKNPVDLFREFYSNVSSSEFSKEKEEILNEIVNEIFQNERGL